jgi:hypothetical protein
MISPETVKPGKCLFAHKNREKKRKEQMIKEALHFADATLLQD